MRYLNALLGYENINDLILIQKRKDPPLTFLLESDCPATLFTHRGPQGNSRKPPCPKMPNQLIS